MFSAFVDNVVIIIMRYKSYYSFEVSESFTTKIDGGGQIDICDKLYPFQFKTEFMYDLSLAYTTCLQLFDSCLY